MFLKFYCKVKCCQVIAGNRLFQVYLGVKNRFNVSLARQEFILQENVWRKKMFGIVVLHFYSSIFYVFSCFSLHYAENDLISFLPPSRGRA